MALTFPLALSQFFAGLPIETLSFYLPESLLTSGVTGGGEILTSDQGTRLWQGDVAIKPMLGPCAEKIKVKLATLGQAGRSFFIYNDKYRAPANDPNGLILGAATPKIKSIATNNRDITIKALPVGYILSDGDYFSFAYGSNPTRYALHQIVTGGTANGSGEVTVEVSTFIRAGAVADINIVLIKPFCKAVLVPGSISAGSVSGRFFTGISFSWRQSLR